MAITSFNNQISKVIVLFEDLFSKPDSYYCYLFSSVLNSLQYSYPISFSIQEDKKWSFPLYYPYFHYASVLSFNKTFILNFIRQKKAIIRLKNIKLNLLLLKHRKLFYYFWYVCIIKILLCRHLQFLLRFSLILSI